MTPQFRRLCRVLVTCVWGALALLLLGLGYLAFAPWAWMPELLGGVVPDLALWQRLCLGGLVAALAVPLVLALLTMRRLFANYANGRVFDRHSAAAISQIGWLLAIGTVLKLIAQPIGSALLTAGFAPGTRSVALTLGSEDILLGLLALLLIVIGRAMAEAVRIEAEHRSII